MPIDYDDPVGYDDDVLYDGGVPSSGPTGGWGDLPWGLFPWGLGAVATPQPRVPTTTILEFPEPLPPLEHVIVGPNGAVGYPEVVGSFSADEDIGFATLQGFIEADRVLEDPDLYTDGAQWLVYDSSSGELVAGADLLTPAISGAVAGLKGDGWGKRLQRVGERLLYQARGYADLWVPKNSEPYGGDGVGFYTQAEEKFNVSSDGALRWTIGKGTDGWNTGDQQGFVAFFGGLRPGVVRIAGHIHCSQAGPNFKFRAACSPDPVGPLVGFVDLHDFTSGGTDANFDVEMPVPGPLLCIQAQRTTDGSTTADLQMTMTNLRVNGIAVGDMFTGSDVALDIAGRLGMVAIVEPSAFNVLPLDGGPSGTAASVLDLAATLSGAFYRVVGSRQGTPVLEWRALDSVTWEVIDPEFPLDPVPLPRYDSVLVPYTLSNGVAKDVLEVTLAGECPPLPVSRSYGPITLNDPLPDAVNARLLGETILRAVYRARFAGTVTFSRVLSQSSNVVSGHAVHAGDTLYLPLAGGVTVRTSQLRRTGSQIECTLDEGVASVDRIVARTQRAALLRAPI